jgi:hypothetical protein
MSEQRLPFEPRRPSWVNRLWREIPPGTRRQLVAALAEMARNEMKRRPKKQRQEKRDES